MLSEIELAHYCERFQLSDAARRYILMTRASPPFRAVQSSAYKNVCTAFASRKMERTINTESKTAEFAFAREFEFDDDVFEFWDQPQPVTVTRTNAQGKQHTSSYFPDYLVLRKRRLVVVQVKRFEEIERLQARAPQDWVIGDGIVSYLPADRAFEPIGIRHEVLTTASLPPVRSANLGLLLRARDVRTLIKEELRHGIERCLRPQACKPLAQVASELALSDLTPLLQLIDRGELFARLDADALGMPQTAWVARRPEYLSAIALPASPANDMSHVPVALPSEASLAHALKRMEWLKGGAAKRTRTRLRMLMRQAKRVGGSVFEGLLPSYKNCGNRRRRINAIQEQLINDSILKFYATSRRSGPQAAFRLYEVTARERHPEYPVVCRKTFCEFLARVDPAAIGAGRGGQRAANAAAGPSPVETRDPLPLRPFERAAIDHCQLPISVVLYKNGKQRIVRQPWVTALRDVATGCILAVWLSLNNPSCVADAMVLRRCVELHGLLPEQISSDRGSDFWSIYFRSVLAHHGVDHSLSPPAYSRINSPIERVFGEMRTTWLMLRPGNTAEAANARSVSRTHKAQETAELELRDVWNELLMFVDWFNLRANHLDGKSPAEHLSDGLTKFTCSGISVVDDSEFRIATAVDVRNFKFDSKDGLRVNDRRYWCTALTERRPARGRVLVRLEPENPHIVYARVNGSWHRCMSTDTDRFSRLALLERLTEATRLMDGRELLRHVREECQREFTQKIVEVDRVRESKPSTETPRAPEQIPLLIPRSLFEEIRELPVELPTETQHEVSEHELVRIRRR